MTIREALQQLLDSTAALDALRAEKRLLVDSISREERDREAASDAIKNMRNVKGVYSIDGKLVQCEPGNAPRILGSPTVVR